MASISGTLLGFLLGSIHTGYPCTGQEPIKSLDILSYSIFFSWFPFSGDYDYKNYESMKEDMWWNVVNKTF